MAQDLSLKRGEVAGTIARMAGSTSAFEPRLGRITIMKGVQFLIDDEGERKAVMIDLSVHSELWEDFFDAVVAKERQDEPRETLEEVRRKVLGN